MLLRYKPDSVIYYSSISKSILIELVCMKDRIVVLMLAAVSVGYLLKKLILYAQTKHTEVLQQQENKNCLAALCYLCNAIN
jgi:hypothetical protein